MRRKKGLVIDQNDICYEEECEEVGFEVPCDIKGNLVEGFSFTDDPVNFAPVAAAKATPGKPIGLFILSLCSRIMLKI